MPTVIIDSFPACATQYVDDWTIVVVDVIRFTTTVTTALHMGRDVYPARTSDEAWRLAEKLDRPLLAGELGGNVPYGFDLSNSPVQVSALESVPCGPFSDADRPIVLISSSGSQLLMNAASGKHVYLGCLRNLGALSKHLIAKHEKVAVLGAGTRGQFRREDQICCAWIAQLLIEAGYDQANMETGQLIDKWREKSTDTIRDGRSAEYLRQSGQIHDLEFVLHYQEDLTVLPILDESGRIVDAQSDQRA